MKTNRYLLGLALLVVGTMPAFSQVSNNNEDGVNKIDARDGQYDFVPGQVLVKFKDDSSAGIQRARGKFKSSGISTVDNLLKGYGVRDVEKLFPNEEAKPKARLRRTRAYNGSVVEEKNLDKVFWVKTKVESPDSTIQLIEKLKAMPEVEYAEPNYHFYITADMPNNSLQKTLNSQRLMMRAPNSETNTNVICATPENNALYSQQYGIKLHNIDKLWNKPILNKKRPVIAILDTGVDITHPDLKDNIWTNTKELEGETAYDDDGNNIVDDEYGWNFVENHYDVTDRNGHGTHVAGIAAACDNNNGIVGANPQALIMPVKVMNDRGQGDIATICRGMIYAADMGADIINMSFGHAGWISQTEKETIQKAYITTILVASAGNNGESVYSTIFGPLWPAAYYLVLGVQSSGKDGKLVGWSNYDPDGPIFSEDGIDGRNHEMMLSGVDIYSTLPGGQYNKLSGTSMSAPLLSGAISALKMVKEYPSKDVLFGDLIHLNADFEKIFSDETPRTPKIDLVALNYDDSKEGNGDGMVDAGETVDFYVVLRNTWADATNIRFRISVVDEKYKNLVQIENPEVNFGYSLSAYGRETCKTPIRVKFANNIGQNTRIKFSFEIRCDESNETIIQTIYVTVYNMVKLGGLISKDQKLTADHTYLVTDNIGIMEGATLTIEPGTRIEFMSGMGLSSFGKLVANGTPGKPIVFTHHNNEIWAGINSHKSTSDNPRDTISYCIIDGYKATSLYQPYMYNCILKPDGLSGNVFLNLSGKHLNITDLVGGNAVQFGKNFQQLNDGEKMELSNIVNNDFGYGPEYTIKNNLPRYNQINNNNYFNNSFQLSGCNSSNSRYEGKLYSLQYVTETPSVQISNTPSYLGTSSEQIIRPYIFEIGNAPYTYGSIDLSNMLSQPYAEAHGIVWKVVVNGYDAQDEYDQMPPLGVGKHKFEVYFNRPMNKLKIPQITFGVREPYNQHSVDEDGSWNEEGTIYTAYKTITGRTMSDGVNRIYVQGAEDNEFFECPYEKTRFNINLQAAGSMATGFMAEAGLGRVNLTWNNENNDFEDAMGFNIYRYTVDENGKADTICINKEIVDIETTEYSDYDVTPGTTYYYLYRVLSTDLKEYDVSNVVTATPLTSIIGDANGSGKVDVTDVMTTVNYALGMDQKPFIFEAADVNVDQLINVLDVIGIVQIVLHPNAARTRAENEAEVVYTIEDGMLYLDTPVALGGFQVQLALDEPHDLIPTETLKGFELASTWLTDNDYRLMAYSFGSKTLPSGKHAVLYIGDADITSLCFSDTQGNEIKSKAGDTTSVEGLTVKRMMNTEGVFNLNGQKVSGSAKALKHGVYIINGQKVVK